MAMHSNIFSLGGALLIAVVFMADICHAVQPTRAETSTRVATSALPPADNTSPAEAEYKRMLLLSPELREADQSIRETLTEAASTLPNREYKKIMAQHQLWREKDFLPNVCAYQETGLDQARAWAMEMGNHADVLGILVEAALLRCNAKAEEGVYKASSKRDGVIVNATLLLKQVDADHSVSIIVEQQNATPPKQCTFSGTGTLMGDTLSIAIEDQPESLVTLTLGKQRVRVTASPRANAECDAPLILDGTYTKEGCNIE